MATSLAAHTLEVARELMDDIELSRLAPEALLLKASRLARIVGDDTAARWIRYELNGYPNDQLARPWMLRFGRLENDKATYGYWQPFSGLTGAISAMQTQMQQIKVPDIQFAPQSANPAEIVTGFAGATVAKITKPAEDVLQRLQLLTTAVSTMSGIRSRVLNGLHEFAVRAYYDRAFSGVAESIFERHQSAIDALLAAHARDVLEKVPSIHSRLAEGDTEAISQALNSVRRMIKAFADSVYPPSDQPVTKDGQSYEVGSDKALNRIKLYLAERCASGSRRDRLIRNLRQVHERASAGSHADVTGEEAQALFLQAYLTLGEILAAGAAEPLPPVPVIESHLPVV